MPALPEALGPGKASQNVAAACHSCPDKRQSRWLATGRAESLRIFNEIADSCVTCDISVVSLRRRGLGWRSPFTSTRTCGLAIRLLTGFWNWTCEAFRSAIDPDGSWHQEVSGTRRKGPKKARKQGRGEPAVYVQRCNHQIPDRACLEFVRTSKPMSFAAITLLILVLRATTCRYQSSTQLLEIILIIQSRWPFSHRFSATTAALPPKWQ